MQALVHSPEFLRVGRNPWRAAVVLAVVLTFCGARGFGQTQTAIPVLSEYVTDQTNTLSEPERASLDARLRAFDDSTSTQIVVVVLPTIGQDVLEEVSLKIVEANKVGRKGKDNGALLLIVKNDRLIRIEVGYGLEGVLTDALSAQIIRREIAPRFKEGDFAGGIEAGVDAIMKATRNEYTAEPRAQERERTFPLPFVMLIIFFLIALSRVRRGRRSIGGMFPPIGGGWGGGFGGGGGGSFGGGGFSGGGGSFGGGGSSGGW
jgi:uncharacterized protein